MWINSDPSQPALAENATIDTGTARSAALYVLFAIGLITAAAMVLP